MSILIPLALAVVILGVIPGKLMDTFYHPVKQLLINQDTAANPYEMKVGVTAEQRQRHSVDDGRGDFSGKRTMSTTRHPERTREGSGRELQSQMLREYAQHDNLHQLLTTDY